MSVKITRNDIIIMKDKILSICNTRKQFNGEEPEYFVEITMINNDTYRINCGTDDERAPREAISMLERLQGELEQCRGYVILPKAIIEYDAGIQLVREY